MSLLTKEFVLKYVFRFLHIRLSFFS